ncbi:hypothetical protein D3C71_1278870 [compost metagenome]
MAADVTRHFATAGGETHQRNVLQIQRIDHRSQIIGIVIHVIAVPRLAGTTVATTIVCDHAVTVVGQEHHLRFPAVRIQRPAVAEGHHRPVLRTPVLVVQLHAIGGGDDAGGARDAAGCGRISRLGSLGGQAHLHRQGQGSCGERAGNGVHGGPPADMDGFRQGLLCAPDRDHW